MPDASAPQVVPDGPVAVCLIGGDAAGLLAGPARPEFRDADLLQDRLELGAVRPLTWRDDQKQRAATAIRTQVDLAGEPAPRAAQALTSRTTSTRRRTTSTRRACRLCHGVSS